MNLREIRQEIHRRFEMAPPGSTRRTYWSHTLADLRSVTDENRDSHQQFLGQQLEQTQDDEIKRVLRETLQLFVIGPGWSDHLTPENCYSIARIMYLLLQRWSRFREVYKKGNDEHLLPGMRLRPYHPEESICHYVRGPIHTLEITTIHNVLFVFDTRDTVTITFTDQAITIRRFIGERIIEELCFESEGS